MYYLLSFKRKDKRDFEWKMKFSKAMINLRI